MSTQKSSDGLCPRSVIEQNLVFSFTLADLHMTLLHWKTVKGLVHLGALALAGFAIAEGADPLQAAIIAAVIIQGPEVLEYLAVKSDESESKDNE